MIPDTPLQQADNMRKLLDKINNTPSAILTTRSGNELHSRPMKTVESQDFGVVWLFSDIHTDKTNELDRSPNVSVTYVNTQEEIFVAISGTATLQRDPKLIRKYWNPMLRSWFPKGVDDPNLALIKVTINMAEYWDTSPSAVTKLFNVAKAAVTGQKSAGGEHGLFTFASQPLT